MIEESTVPRRRSDMVKRITMLCIVLSVSGAAWAGDLTPIAGTPQQQSPYQRMYARGGGFTEPPAEAGAVSENATVVKFTNGQTVIHGMIDSSKADAEAPDVLRLDFTGKGTFANKKHVVPLKVRQQNNKIFQTTFGPATVQAELDGRTVPVAIQGMYYKRGTTRSAYLMASTGAKGECDFGGKTCPVQLMDNTGNLRLTDSPSVKLVDGQIKWGPRRGMISGDTIQVDTGDGNTSTAFYGQPVLVGGKWYGVTVSKNGKTVSAKALKLKTGTIDCGAKKWSAMLIGEKNLLSVSSQGGAVAVPAGAYALANYTEMGGGKAQLACGRRELYTGKAKMIEVAKGKATSLPAGSPLQMTVAVSVRKGQVRMNLAMTDAAGTSVDSVTTEKGGRPPAPKVEILDTSGASVHKAKLEYG
jgi:hypothetical protein